MGRIYAFHGAEHRVGTTMLAQSVAEMIAANSRGTSVLLVSLNNRRSTDYVREEVSPIDDFRARLESGISIDRELISSIGGSGELYMISGPVSELDERSYMPEAVTNLISTAGNQFDVIIEDTGSELDNGLAFGGLRTAGMRFLTLTPSESSVRRYELNRALYAEAGIEFEAIVVNRYSPQEIYDLKYLSDRLKADRRAVYKVADAPYGLRAEMEYRTLLAYGYEKYAEGICALANLILEDAGLPAVSHSRRGRERRRQWISST